jgi:hypothetical protein
MSAKYFGLYRARVMNNEDPMGRQRLTVMIPSVLENSTTWAESCVAWPGQVVPAIGSLVWVQFEEGDPVRPVWMGVVR